MPPERQQERDTTQRLQRETTCLLPGRAVAGRIDAGWRSPARTIAVVCGYTMSLVCSVLGTRNRLFGVSPAGTCGAVREGLLVQHACGLEGGPGSTYLMPLGH
jgi:hypothetical protein